MENPIVTMEASVRIHLNKAYSEGDTVLYIGGFAFLIDNQEVPFDFDACACFITEISDGGKTITIDYSTGQGPFFNDPHLSEDFDTIYQEKGLDRGALTAEYLAKATQISEFFVNAEANGTVVLASYELLSVSLWDDSDEHKLSEEVLALYNAQH